MVRLIKYELGKVWGKRSFVILMSGLLLINIFLFWYLNVPDDCEPKAYSYKHFLNDIEMKNDEEILSYVSDMKENIDKVLRYGDEYKEKTFIKYTTSIYQEQTFISRLYDELKITASYDDYLKSVAESGDTLGQISIFAQNEKASFSSRNIEKSARDHLGLSDRNIKWQPQKWMQDLSSYWVVDLLLLMSVLLFVGTLITEEKEKKTFYFTRPTKNGMTAGITAKMGALLIHSVTITILMYGSCIWYVKGRYGFRDLNASIQSLADFTESKLDISILGYLVASVAIKAITIFIFGLFVVAISLISKKYFAPQMAAIGVFAISLLLYLVIPGYSILNPIKYLSVFGMMKSDLLLGKYLNFNIFGFPVERLTMALWVLLILALAGIAINIFIFSRTQNLSVNRRGISLRLPLKAHGSLFRHESYKILIMEKALIIMLAFVALIGYGDLSSTYNLSVKEQYYQDMMMNLEGETNLEKKAIIHEYNQRFEEAFSQIEKIDGMVSSGQIDRRTGDDMKAKWYGETYFYTSFKRILEQEKHIEEKGGIFLYDTGYRYLFGTMNDGYLTDFILLSLCVIFAFGNVMVMEYRNGSWNILSPTAKGKNNVCKAKMLLCILWVSVIGIIPWIFRIVSVARHFPMNFWGESIHNIPMYFDLKLNLPIWVFAIFVGLIQIIVLQIICAGVLVISARSKDYIQTIFVGILIFVVPLILITMGFDFARSNPLYVLYDVAGRM